MNHFGGAEHSSQPYRFYSTNMSLYYYYDEVRDEIVYESGARVRRPPNVPRDNLLATRVPRTLPGYQAGSNATWQTPDPSRPYAYSAAHPPQPGPSTAPATLSHQGMYAWNPPGNQALHGHDGILGSTNALSKNLENMSLQGQAPATVPTSQTPQSSRPVRVTKTRQTSQGSIPKSYHTLALIENDSQYAPENTTQLHSSKNLYTR